MGKKSAGIEETPAERAQAEIGAQQMQDWRARWAPLLKTQAANTMKALAPDSYERRHAEAQSGIDTAVRFGQAQEEALKTASQNGLIGSARQKLALTGIGEDQATSNTFGRVAADQAVTDAATQGLGSIAATGRGQKATAINGLAGNAQLAARQAAQDAELSLENRIGNAGLAATIAGTGAGLWLGQQQKPMAGIQGNDIGLSY